jgi:hypothetical protein
VGRSHRGNSAPQAGACELLLAVGTDVLEEEVAEDEPLDAVVAGVVDRAAHELLVLLVGARPRQLHDVQRQTEALRLGDEELASHGVHGHPIGGRVHRHQKTDDLDLGIGTSRGEGEGAVLAAAPAHPRSAHGADWRRRWVRHAGERSERSDHAERERARPRRVYRMAAK